MITNSQKRKLYGIVGAFVVLVFPLFVLLTSSPSDLVSEQSFCPFKMLTGMPCPGCGITKSLVFLYLGEVTASVKYHILGVPVVVFSAITILVLGVEILIGRNLPTPMLYSRRIAYVLGGLLGAYHLGRVVYFVSTHTFDAIIQESIWM